MSTLVTGGATSRTRPALDDDVDLARDRVLVTRAQAGDRSAFDDLYLRYYRRLSRFCLRRLHDDHEAEDVAQEAFVRAWKALPTFAGDRRFYPWLSVIASHLCTDVARRRHRSTPVAEFHQGNVVSTEDGGEELAMAAVDSAMVAEAFGHLSERYQRVLNLREASGWSYQRIAEHEGVGVTAVETLLWRARQALKREFASLAGADGRSGVLAGAGALSLAALRRLVRTPVAVGRRIAQGGPGAAVALGAAAAAAAFAVAAGIGAPSVTPHGSVAHPASPPTAAPRTTVAGPRAVAPAGTVTASGVSSPGVGAVPAPPEAIPGAAGPLGATVGGTVKGLGDLLGAALRGLGTIGTGGSGLGTLVSGVGSGLVGSVGGTVGGVEGTLGRVAGAAPAAPSASGTSSPSLPAPLGSSGAAAATPTPGSTPSAAGGGAVPGVGGVLPQATAGVTTLLGPTVDGLPGGGG